MCARPASTAASAPHARLPARKARCAAGTSPAPESIPWGGGRRGQRRFRSRAELEAALRLHRAATTRRVVVYCRIGERSSHTWFVLTHLLGIPGVRNYDGSWTEWGNAVRVPIVARGEPGEPPRLMSMPAPLAEVAVRLRAKSRARTSCSCCWSSPTTCPRCPTDLEEAAIEPVPECQSPLFLHVEAHRPEIASGCSSSAPAEAPTTRGFAAILAAGLDEQLAADSPGRARGLLQPTWVWPDLISPLRLRGMSAMLARIKRRAARAPLRM